jgi:hypothetical protein
VRLSLGGTLAAQTSFGGGQVLAQVRAAAGDPSAKADGVARNF